jgi:hypothetical protein
MPLLEPDLGFFGGDEVARMAKRCRRRLHLLAAWPLSGALHALEAGNPPAHVLFQPGPVTPQFCRQHDISPVIWPAASDENHLTAQRPHSPRASMVIGVPMSGHRLVAHSAPFSALVIPLCWMEGSTIPSNFLRDRQRAEQLGEDRGSWRGAMWAKRGAEGGGRRDLVPALWQIGCPKSLSRAIQASTWPIAAWDALLATLTGWAVARSKLYTCTGESRGSDSNNRAAIPET